MVWAAAGSLKALYATSLYVQLIKRWKKKCSEAKFGEGAGDGEGANLQKKNHLPIPEASSTGLVSMKSLIKRGFKGSRGDSYLALPATPVNRQNFEGKIHERIKNDRASVSMTLIPRRANAGCTRQNVDLEIDYILFRNSL